MRIATWNIERLKHKNKIDDILLACEAAKADILILTETDDQIILPLNDCFKTAKLTGIEPALYKPTERRVAIYTNYECVAQHPTFDKHTAVCVELETDLGNLVVYGTIIGVEGNRRVSFAEDLRKQVKDIAQLNAIGKSLCIAGDFNISFSDNYYFTNEGRNTLRRCFAQNRIKVLTEDVAECVDHIAVSEQALLNAEVAVAEWNLNKKLSDHKGIVAEIRSL